MAHRCTRRERKGSLMTQVQETIGSSTQRASPRTAAMHNTAWGSAHANSLHARFKVNAFDFFFAWIMGAQTHSVSETGELLVLTGLLRGRVIEQRATGKTR